MNINITIIDGNILVVVDNKFTFAGSSWEEVYSDAGLIVSDSYLSGDEGCEELYAAATEVAIIAGAHF